MSEQSAILLSLTCVCVSGTPAHSVGREQRHRYITRGAVAHPPTEALTLPSLAGVTGNGEETYACRKSKLTFLSLFLIRMGLSSSPWKSQKEEVRAHQCTRGINDCGGSKHSRVMQHREGAH